MENDSKALVKRSQQPGDLENDFPNDAKRSKHQEGPNISLEVGEEGQEEMMKLCQGLMEFYKAIDGKRKEMEDHQAKVEKVQKKEKAVLNEKNDNQDQEPADTNDGELPVTTQKGVARDVPAEQLVSSCHTSKVNVQSFSKFQENGETNKSTAMIDVNCELRAEQPKNHCLAFNIISPSQTSTSQENNKTGDKVPATTEDEAAPDVSAEQLQDPCQIPTNIPMPSSSSTQKNGKNEKNKKTGKNSAIVDVSCEPLVEQLEISCPPKNISIPSSSSSQQLHKDEQSCYKCLEGERLYGQTVLECMNPKFNPECMLKIGANELYYRYKSGAQPPTICEKCFGKETTCNKAAENFNFVPNVPQPVPYYKCRCGRIAHRYCTHPEDKEATFQCDNCTEEVKQFPNTADLPKNELTKTLEEELLRRMRQFDENAMFTVSELCYQENLILDLDKLPASVKENFETVKKVKGAVRTISVSQKIGDGNCCMVQWMINEATTADKDGRKWTFPQYLDSVRVFKESENKNGELVRDPRNRGGAVAAIILEEYFKFMKQFGYTRSFLVAEVPEPGKEYLFFMRPSWQEKVQLSQKNLLRWYSKTFEEMKKNESIIGYKVLPSTTVPSTSDPSTSVEQSEAANEPNNFVIKITEDGETREMDGTDIFDQMSVKIASSQSEFYDHLSGNKLEFSSLRWIRYSTAVLSLHVQKAVAEDKKRREAIIQRKLKEKAKKEAKKSKAAKKKVQEPQGAENQLE
ncbi:hypothetical protein B9Z55_026686 [Caenorhabditis nigoni]|uniref:histone acetyltransferase n=1 Tax=Caenorhabditis nigoni TaxID=1611254 RepID=A0A2G5T4J7_9PELO|nr:hypothetical protein B9Z55_026686 [Caenorhabditis nigoni]